MKSKPRARKYFFAITLVALFSIIIIGVSGQRQKTGQNSDTVTDTVPKNKVNKKIQNLDDVINDLDRAQLELNMEKIKSQLNEAMKNIDMGKMQLEMDKAMKDLDMSKLKMEIENSMKGFDAEKMKMELEKAMKDVDLSKMKLDMENSMKELDMEKSNKQLKESLDKVDWDKMKVEMEDIKKIDMSKIQDELNKVQEEMKKLGPQIENEMENAKVEIEKAKKEMVEYKDFVDGLDKDGLINKKEDYTIQEKSGDLIINGKKQPLDVYNKYRSFLDKHKNFKIEKSGSDFNIHNNNKD